MRLSTESFNALHDALMDRAQDRRVLDLMATQCHRSPDLFVSENATLPVAVMDLVRDCASQDTLEDFIECLKQRFGGNILIDALEFAALTSAPSDADVVAAGGGGAEFKGRLANALSRLGQPGMQLVAAQELADLLDEASDTEAKTLYLAVLGNLKIDRSPDVVRSLVPVMGNALKRLIGQGPRPDSLELDLDRTRLPRIDLSKLDLHEADIAFADLRYANLDHANLYRVRGYAVDLANAGFNAANLEEARLHAAVAVKARFHNARMVSIFFKEANLGEAEFQQAKLQGAHFERADLRGARFERAILSDAYFTDTTLDQPAIASMARAVGWESARFDPGVRAAIEQVL